MSDTMTPSMTTFILAVDHRNSLRGGLASLGVPAERIDASARRLKVLCVEALAAARPQLHDGEAPMLLLDEEYGVEAIPTARRHGLPVVIPAERSGQAEFQFEHGDGFGEAIERADPAAVKALVRYNLEGDPEANARSRQRLLALQSYLRQSQRRFMLELLVPPTEEQHRRHGEDFDEVLRPALTVGAIEELLAGGLRPDWWKLEGNNDPAAARAVAGAAAGAAEIGCLVLGRGQDRSSVVHWVQVAAAAGGFVGFAVGRTLWTEPHQALVAGEIEEGEAVSRIAAAYLDIAAAYRSAQPASDASGATGGDGPEGE
jgi:myo-inositol catabolism protein IolC